MRGGVDEEIWEVVTQVAKKQGLNVQPIVITGTASPNEALNNGDLDANAFQHIPFPARPGEAARLQDRGGGGYADLADRLLLAQVQVAGVAAAGRAPPAFPMTRATKTRALVILRDHGLIKLRDGFDPYTGTATLADVTANPKKLDLVESASVVLARSLPDVDAAAVVNTFAYQAGLIATRDRHCRGEEGAQPYVNVIAVRERDKAAPWVAPLIKGVPLGRGAQVHPDQVPGLGDSGVLSFGCPISDGC
ncbi:MetQ/NlpA family ABC transporter substrate-binding protein [Cupriavidus basilensis]